jgi:hypothetical protein
VFRQPSYATWSRHGLRHCLLISQGHPTRVGSRPRLLVVLPLVELATTILSSGVMASLAWLALKVKAVVVPYPVVGGVVRLSCQAVFGRWAAVLVVTARRCCLVRTAWRRDGV